MEIKNNALIIFGGTGDLTKRKLIPALYNLAIDQELPDNFFVVAVGRRPKTTQQYVTEMEQSVKEFSRNKFTQAGFERIQNRIFYYQLDFNQEQEYAAFNRYLCDLENIYHTQHNRLYYLAVSPEYFGVIVNSLHRNQMTEEGQGYKRVMIEKPFGRDLKSARQLSKTITNAFDESNTYRIDHYLGKEMLQNIMVIRFANALFEPIWNNKYIDHIQIISTETLGVSERGGYYDQSGALKDMIQNHLLQILAITAMEPPVRLDTESIRDEKVKVFKGLKIYSEQEVAENVVRGQYGPNPDKQILGYRQESRTEDHSNTETFVALKAEIENFRWAGVPFYLRSGKRLDGKTVEVIIQFKSLSKILYLDGLEDSQPNQLVIRIQPTEGIYLKFNAKKPGQNNDILPVKMDFCQNCEIGYNSPEAYERLLLDAMKGEKTLFTRWDEVDYSWRFIDSILQAWSKQEPEFPNYMAGSSGPVAADQLLAKDGYKWWKE